MTQDKCRAASGWVPTAHAWRKGQREAILGKLQRVRNEWVSENHNTRHSWMRQAEGQAVYG